MAKVTGPLFSMTAKGTLGDAICFKGTGLGARVTKPPKGKDIETGPRLQNRASYMSAVSFWWGLHVHEREFYNFLGNQVRMTGFNFCVGRYMEGWMA